MPSDSKIFKKMIEGEGLPLDKTVVTVGGPQYGKSMVAEALAKKVDEDMMALYGKTHPKEAAALASIAWKENGMSETFNLKNLKSAPTVPLLEAEMLYQPVKGTSNGSRYFVMALGIKVSVSLRWIIVDQGVNSLSLRIEGPGLNDMVPLLTEMGFDKKSDHHWAVHLKAESDVSARKAVGATLFGLNQDWLTIMPTPDVVRGI